MNWLCATVAFCISFTPLNMEYSNKEEFIQQSRACAMWYNHQWAPVWRVPWQLAVAQAIQESNYGTSYFTEEANNLMGIKEFDENEPHIKPRNNPDADWGIKVFNNKCESMMFYMDLLNENHHYDDFRNERLKQYVSDKADLEKLAKTLAVYAEDVYYPSKIIKIMKELESYE
tara:strand:+ start:744 stop:1262 length:519 start_codon:yes stop_codon:yes gene_type:complete